MSRDDIKDIPYLESEATEADIADLKDCVYEIETGIFYLYETPHFSEFSIRVMRDAIQELLGDRKHYILVVDLSRARRPNAEARRHLKNMYSVVKPSFAIAFTGRNRLLTMAVRFVFTSLLDHDRYEIFRTREEALDAARQKLSEQ